MAAGCVPSAREAQHLPPPNHRLAAIQSAALHTAHSTRVHCLILGSMAGVAHMHCCMDDFGMAAEHCLCLVPQQRKESAKRSQAGPQESHHSQAGTARGTSASGSCAPSLPALCKLPSSAKEANQAERRPAYSLAPSPTNRPAPTQDLQVSVHRPRPARPVAPLPPAAATAAAA